MDLKSLAYEKTGLKPVTGTYLYGSQACPLYALSAALGNYNIDKLENTLGISQYERNDFIRGFDGSYNSSESEFYLIGKELRELFQKEGKI